MVHLPDSVGVMSRTPNLIICMCDELRWCGLGCYGHPTIRTPNIDALAARGVRFETAVSNNPVCMPARSLLLAGQYSRTCCETLTNAGWPEAEDAPLTRAGFPQWPTRRRKGFPNETLPEILKRSGYATTAIGKWHIEAWPDAIGFDHYLIPAHHHAHTAQWFCEDGGPVFSPEGYSVDYEAARVESFLNGQSGQEDPFFLYYNISPPHMPLADAPSKYLEMYGREDVFTRPNVPDGYVVPEKAMLSYLWDYRAYRDHLPYAVKPHAAFDRVDLEAYYMGLTTWVDDVVGRMMNSLQASGLDNNTVVIFTSDHGDNFGSHGHMGKGSLNDESCRIPMIVAGPGNLVEAGQVVTGQVASLIDLAPTLLACAGESTPDHMSGQDLTPVIQGRQETLAEPAAFIETLGHGIGIRTPKHMLGIGYEDSQHDLASSPTCFWNTVEDPYELENLAESGAQAPLARELETRLRGWHCKTPWLGA
jgi:arylsulfatase A-like enzyme